MESTQQYTPENASFVPQTLNGNHTDASISYEEYKALESGFLEEKRKLEDRMWLDSNMSQFDEILRQNYDSSLRKFSEKVITHIAKITGAVYGAFFTVDYDTKTVNATGGYACTVETMDRTTFNLGEGLVGQVAKSKELLCLDNVETQLDSSLGRISACFLAISPLIFSDRVYGIIELTTLSKLKPRYIVLLERMSRSIAAVLQSLINNQRTKELLIESLQQSEDFKTQREELLKRDAALHTLREQLQMKEQELQKLIGNFESNETGISIEGFSKLNGELLIAQTALEQMRADWQKQQNEIAALTDSKDKYESTENTIEKQEQQIKDLKESLHWKHEEIERQGNVLQERKQDIEKLQNAILENENENKRFLEEIIRQEKNLQQKEQALASLHTQLQETVANAHIPAEISQLQNLLQQKETLYQQLQQTLETERLNYVEQEESMQKIIAENDNKSTEFANLEQQWAVQTQIWQAWQQTAQEHEAELKALQTSIIADKALIDNFQAEYTTLKTTFETEVAFGQNIETQLNQLKDEYHTQQNELATLKEEATQHDSILKGLREELRQREAETQQHQREIQELNTRLSKKEDELLVTQYMLNQMQSNPLINRETERLNKELETKDLEIKKLQNRLPDTANTEQDRIEQTNIEQANNEQINKFLGEIAEQQEEIAQMQEEVKRYTEAFESVNESYETASEDLENVKQYATIKENEVEHLQKLLQEAQIQNQEAPEISNLVAELREKDTLAKELAEKLSAYSAPDSYIQTQYNNIQQKIKDLEIVQQHLADRETELDYLKETIETQKEQLTQTQTQTHPTQTRENQADRSKEQEELAQLRNQIEAKQQEMRRRESELADLFNKINTAFAMLEIDMAGKVLSVNNKLLFHLGLSVDEMLYQDFNKFIKYAETNEYKQVWQELTSVGATQIINDFVMIGRKDREIKMNVTFIPILDATGKPYEIIQLVNFLIDTEDERDKKMVYSGNYTEINTENIADTAVLTTQKIETQITNEIESFDEEREIFKAIQNSFMLIELDTEGKVINANHQIALCLGYEEAELIGKLYTTLLHEDEQDSGNYQDILSHLGSGHYATEVLTYVGKEMEKITLRSYFNPLKDSDDKTRKVLVMSQYIH